MAKCPSEQQWKDEEMYYRPPPYGTNGMTVRPLYYMVPNDGRCMVRFRENKEANQVFRVLRDLFS